MTETPRPVPAGPRPGPPEGSELTTRLDGRPVAEHAAEFELEHERLQRRLATIDQL